MTIEELYDAAYDKKIEFITKLQEATDSQDSAAIDKYESIVDSLSLVTDILFSLMYEQ